MRASTDSRHWLKVIAGPVAALLVYALTADWLDEPARRTAAVATLMAAWWMSEALPLAATALLPLALFPLLGVMDIKATATPYASHIIFLFLGGFLLGLAMQKSGLHRRVALAIVHWAGTGPRRMIGGFMLASALLSMWISNTATVVMLMPVALSTLAMLEEGEGHSDPALANALLLGTGYAASIGGLGTLLGSPPNLVLASFAERELGMPVTMLDWIQFGLPAVAILLPLTWWLLTHTLFHLPKDLPGDPGPVIRRALTEMGRMSPAEKRVAMVFTSAATLWICRGWLGSLPGLSGLSDAGIAIAAAIALFLLPDGKGEPLLDWETAEKTPWGILLLFGGGLSLAAAIGASGLDAAIAGSLGGLAGLPLWVSVTAVVFMVVFVTELSSNTATANAFIPILAAVAVGLSLPPLPMLVAVAMAASCAFMLPVATPPNAIVFGSGRVPLQQMIRAGLVLNLLLAPIIALLIVLMVA
ncbi:MAG: DASS family sodium-coupled anion symporter [Gammaproteobacteria bacterium]|nr:DASS family sodium-coupled anion symporter [Gammaproteobacteria bacterium]